MSDYDGIIIGAGHNGLILQAYLGKAALPARIRADPVRHSHSPEPLRSAATRRTPRRIGKERRWPPPPGGQRAVAARVRASGVREPDREGGSAFLQRAARGRSAGQRL